MVVRGKLGSTKKAPKATTTVTTPSIINSHFHARMPLAPSMLPVIPADIRPEKAPEMRAPLYRTDVLKPSSFRVYQQDR